MTNKNTINTKDLESLNLTQDQVKESALGKHILESKTKISAHSIGLVYDKLINKHYSGSTDFGRRLDECFMSSKASKSIGYRVMFIKNYLRQFDSKNIASMACGLGIEISREIALLNNLFCYDIDEDALDGLRQKNPIVTTILQNVLLVRSKIKFDVIYSGGLFDYLNDDLSKRLLSRFAQMLNKGGQILIGNATHEYDARWAFDNLFDCKMHYRSQSELLSLFPENIKDFKIHSDPMRCNNYVIASL